MYLLVAKRYWRATAIIPKLLIEYSKLFFSFSNKTYIVNVRFTEPTRTIFSFPFLKACVRYFYQVFIFLPNDSPLKTMKNVFYFI